MKSQLALSETEKKSANQRSVDLESQLNELIESTAAQAKSAEDENKGPLSEESRILYNDAFGSFANDSRYNLTVFKKHSFFIRVYTTAGLTAVYKY